jgi:outer membrane protein OmpA-like peptidoglycan-associated protein/tetratricopeptide (TPR) repeat protein
MKKFTTLLVAVVLGAGSLFSQNNVEFTKPNLAKNKELKKIYKSYIKKGDQFYYQFERGYLVALEYYLMAYQKHPNSAVLNYKIADCYLHTLYKYKALPHALKAQELNPQVAFDIDYVLGHAYHQREEFDKALEHYKKFKDNYSGKNNDSLLYVAKRIQECKNGIEFVKDSTYDVVNMGPVINSEFAEYVPLIRADQSYMVFTSRRPQKPVDTNNTATRIKGERVAAFDFEYYEDIFKTDYNKTDSTWSTPYRFDYISDKKGANHDACISLSFDGLTIFTYRGENEGDLFVTNIENGKWGKTEPLKGINSKYREDHIALAYDNKTAYFISNRPGGFGGKDIWKTVKISETEWGVPVNLGPVVNTEYDEDGIFIHPDGKSLYFSSRGHNTMGGYDIFETTFEDEKWNQPLNLGYPVNSPDDDVFFVLTADGKNAYLSSVKEDGYGMQDIYAITPFVKKRHKEFDVVVFKGWVIDEETKVKLNAKVEITDNSTGEKIFSNHVDAERGFLVSLPTGKEGKNYGIAVTVDGYLFYSENFDLEKKPGFKEYEKIVEVEKVKIGSVLVLRNLFFDFNKADLKNESKTELNRAIEILNSYTNVKIQIEGHTDNKGTDEYNLTLSEKRAKAVKEYLILKGFDPNRIVKVIGYGESKPSDTNDTQEGRDRNRRVEFRLVE